MTKIEAEIQEVLDRYYEAFRSHDWEAFATPLADDFRYFTDEAVIRSKGEFLEHLQQSAWRPISHLMSDMRVRFVPLGGMAVATYTMEFRGETDGKETTIIALETAVFERNSGGWQLVHFHSSDRVGK